MTTRSVTLRVLPALTALVGATLLAPTTTIAAGASAGKQIRPVCAATAPGEASCSR